MRISDSYLNSFGKYSQKYNRKGWQKMTLTIVKRYNGKGEEIDETYRPVIPELIDLLNEVYQKISSACNECSSNDIST